MSRERLSLFSGLLAGAAVGCVASHIWLIGRTESEHRKVDRPLQEPAPLLSDLGWAERTDGRLVTAGIDDTFELPFFPDEALDQTVHADGILPDNVAPPNSIAPDPLPISIESDPDSCSQQGRGSPSARDHQRAGEAS